MQAGFANICVTTLVSGTKPELVGWEDWRDKLRLSDLLMWSPAFGLEQTHVLFTQNVESLFVPAIHTTL